MQRGHPKKLWSDGDRRFGSSKTLAAASVWSPISPSAPRPSANAAKFRFSFSHAHTYMCLLCVTIYVYNWIRSSPNSLSGVIFFFPYLIIISIAVLNKLRSAFHVLENWFVTVDLAVYLEWVNAICLEADNFLNVILRSNAYFSCHSHVIHLLWTWPENQMYMVWSIHCCALSSSLFQRCRLALVALFVHSQNHAGLMSDMLLHVTEDLLVMDALCFAWTKPENRNLYAEARTNPFHYQVVFASCTNKNTHSNFYYPDKKPLLFLHELHPNLQVKNAFFYCWQSERSYDCVQFIQMY